MGYENNDRAAAGDPVLEKSVHARHADRLLHTTSSPPSQPPESWQRLSDPIGRLVRDIVRRSGFDVDEAGWSM